MGKTVLVELTSKQIKLTEGIVLVVLFGSIAAGLGLMYHALSQSVSQCSAFPELPSSHSAVFVSGGGG